MSIESNQRAGISFSYFMIIDKIGTTYFYELINRRSKLPLCKIILYIILYMNIQTVGSLLSQHIGQPHAQNNTDRVPWNALNILAAAFFSLRLSGYGMATATQKTIRLVLSIEDKLKICDLVKKGRSLSSLAAEYNVGESAISCGTCPAQTLHTEVQDNDCTIRRADYDELNKELCLIISPAVWYKGMYFSLLVYILTGN